MPTYYPQEAADVVLFVTVALACIIGFAAYVAGLYDLRHPLPYDEVEQPAPVLRDVPNQREIAAQHCAKVHTRRDAADLARGTSDNLVEPGYSYSENLRRSIELTNAVMKGIE